ncbi:MAG TPA: hypothetical protein VFD43_14105, partial [Planctomycetota bacterium]|nr:hypothetical protein [Planctomycetota bacterium]
SPPLPLELWRSTASDPHLSIPPLAPLPGSSQADLDRWTAQIRDTFSPGVSIAEPLSPELLDALTPAFFNAMQGLDMSDGDDIRRASAILDVWHGYQARCSTKRLVRIEFDGDPGWDPDARTADRIWQVETFAMWWRDMSADPQRLADFRRGKSP